MARNLLADHRISAERFRQFAALTGDLGKFGLVQSGIERYHKQHVRPFSDSGIQPAYTRPENQINKVSNPPEYVATVVNLSWMGAVYAEAYKTFGIIEFEDFQGAKIGSTETSGLSYVTDFLMQRFTGRGRERFLTATLEALKLYRNSPKRQRIRPTWVAEWNSLRPFLIPNHPELWLQAVGRPIEEASWLAVFRYPVKRAEGDIELFLPTQLDSGWFAHYFPSPPAAPAGHTMYLGGMGAAAPEPISLVDEYLHLQTDIVIEDWHAGGSLLGLARRDQGELGAQRAEHWERLQKRYDKTHVLGWMVACP